MPVPPYLCVIGYVHDRLIVMQSLPTSVRSICAEQEQYSQLRCSRTASNQLFIHYLLSRSSPGSHSQPAGSIANGARNISRNKLAAWMQ